jgi:homotetrameric cytidine deaminase
MTDIDWDELRAVATEAMQRAYAPYSRYQVGAAALVSDGRIVSGCNVENASYGVGLCAECALVGDLHMSGGGRSSLSSASTRRGDDHAVRALPPAAQRVRPAGNAAGDRLRHPHDR